MTDIDPDLKLLQEAYLKACALKWSDASLDNYHDLRKAAENYYRSFKPIKCPAIENLYVSFSSEGFNHLIYKNKTERNKKEQFGRFKFVEAARDVIGKTTTIQESDEKIQNVVIKKKKKKIRADKLIKYCAFISVTKYGKIKVIIKQLGNGNYTFWSVIPFWKSQEYGKIKFRSYSTTDLEAE